MRTKYGVKYLKSESKVPYLSSTLRGNNIGRGKNRLINRILK